MNIPVLVTMVMTLLILGATLIALPSLSRPTVPLGVSVPSTRADDPVVRAALARYRITIGLLMVIALTGALATLQWPLALAWWALGLLAAGMATFVVCRRPIQRAKAEQDWYAGLTVRLVAPLSPVEPAPVSWLLHLLALGLTLLSALVVTVAFPSLPDPLPTHYGADGVPNAWEPKSLATALLVPAVAVASTVLLATLAAVLARRIDPQPGDGHPGVAKSVRDDQRHLLQRTLGLTNLASAALLGFAAVVPVLNLAPSALSVLVWGGTALTVIPGVWLILRTARLQRDARRAPSGSGPESPDDDRLWIGGLFYYNPSDPSFTVPKRAGVGYDLNLGHPARMAFLVGSALLVLGLVVAPFIFR